MIKVVLFDLDDTLISEYEYVKSGYRDIGRYLAQTYEKCEDDVFEELMQLFHENTTNVFNRWMDLYHLPYETKDIMSLVQRYREHMPKIQFFKDVMPTLEILKQRGIKTGIISDGYLSTQKNKVKVLGAENLFDKIIITEELGREYWKPHPMAFEKMREFFHVEYDEMMYVGDNPKKDFYIGSIYPIQTIRIVREHSVYDDVTYYKGIKETKRIKKLEELQELLK